MSAERFEKGQEPIKRFLDDQEPVESFLDKKAMKTFRGVPMPDDAVEQMRQRELEQAYKPADLNYLLDYYSNPDRQAAQERRKIELHPDHIKSFLAKLDRRPTSYTFEPIIQPDKQSVHPNFKHANNPDLNNPEK